MKFNNWDPKKIDDHSAQAEALYGKTEAWQEYRTKAKDRSKEQEGALGAGLMDLFAKLGTMKHLPADSAEVQAWVKELQGYISQNYYNCTTQILRGLGEMYAGGGSMTENIDAAGGPGTGEFARDAIRIYCK